MFPVVRAHWGDVGGMSPGSLSGGATEIFQEGVRIPPIRVVERGRPNEAALDLIFANMRGPRERRGDYQAMIGTCRKAAERVEALAARYGTGTVRDAVAELMTRAEGRMRRAIVQHRAFEQRRQSIERCVHLLQRLPDRRPRIIRASLRGVREAELVSRLDGLEALSQCLVTHLLFSRGSSLR